jgi:hypothetical protein
MVQFHAVPEIENFHFEYSYDKNIIFSSNEVTVKAPVSYGFCKFF